MCKFYFLIVFLFLSTQGVAMSVFFKGEEAKVTLMSPLSGTMTQKGIPVSNAKIKLWVKWNDPDGETEIYSTDEKGYFQIPSKYSTFKDNPLTQLVVTQELTVELEGESVLIWTLSRTSPEESHELELKLDHLACELTDELTVHRFEETSLATVCKW